MGMAANRRVIPLSTRQEPGSWHVNRGGMPSIVCPVCQLPFELKGYSIQNGGTVTPEVTCGQLNCSWSVRASLGSWNKTKTRTGGNPPKRHRNAGRRRQKRNN